MTNLRSYEYLEDAWQAGVAAWCLSASRHVLGGGRAWLVTVSDGQANWIKQRLLRAGHGIFGLQFCNASSLRRALCLRMGVPCEPLSSATLAFTLRLRALAQCGRQPELGAIARHAGDCLAALHDLAAAGQLGDGATPRTELLPPALHPWLEQVQAAAQWTPSIDRQLRECAAPDRPAGQPLELCVYGWDASHWPELQLLTAAVRAAQNATIYAPLPRGSSLDLQLDWLSTLEEHFGAGFEPCAGVGFAPSHVALVGRLDGTDLPSTLPLAAPEPELLVGLDTLDAAVLARDFIARWLTASAKSAPADGIQTPERLVILSPRRDLSALVLLRALASAGIAVEDELGEVPEPSLDVQVQRAILAFYENEGDVDSLTALVELLNEQAAACPHTEAAVLRAVCPVDPVEMRRLLHRAFGEVQHHGARVLSACFARSDAGAAESLRLLIDHLSGWPASLTWIDALARWRDLVAALGIGTEALQPSWGRWRQLELRDPVPASAFFQLLGSVLDCAPARRSPDGGHRHARVVLTTLDGAMGQPWEAVLFLDSNEGAWPLYPAENAFLEDAQRDRLNQERAARRERNPVAPAGGYLLTSRDLAQLEHFRFLEILGNCAGPVAFAGVARDPAEPSQELYANDWALRCLLESTVAGDKPLDRWRAATRRVKHTPAALPKAERDHLRAVFARRRDASLPFDEYSFNFESLGSADDLPWTNAWSAGDLEAAWKHPATFALKQVFGAVSTHAADRELRRGESWMVGRLVHGWLPAALGAGAQPRRFSPGDWVEARESRLPAVRRATEETLRLALAQRGNASGALALPWWWESTLQKAHWAAARCIDSVADIARQMDRAGVWLSQHRRFHASIGTEAGRLRLQAHADIMLSDQPAPQGAACQLIDLRTGALPPTRPISSDQLERGEGMPLAALIFLALEEGTRPDATQIGIVHPDAAHSHLLSAETREAAVPAMTHLAEQQRSLNFGQRGNPPAAEDTPRVTENLPLATVPIEPAVLTAKFEGRATEARGAENGIDGAAWAR